MKTDRLELRAPTFGDLDELASMLADADGLTYWGPPLSREQSRSWIERNLRRYELDGSAMRRHPAEHEGAGRRLWTGPHAHRGTASGRTGWIVRRDRRGKGIAAEAAAAWRDYAFDTLGLDRIVSMVSEKNMASRRIAEKLGMTVERRAMMDGLPHLMFSIHRDPKKPTMSSRKQSVHDGCKFERRL